MTQSFYVVLLTGDGDLVGSLQSSLLLISCLSVVCIAVNLTMRVSSYTTHGLETVTQRFVYSQAPHSSEGREQDPYILLEGMRVNKTIARELISKSLPVPDAVLNAHQRICHSLCLAQREKRARVRHTSLKLYSTTSHYIKYSRIPELQHSCIARVMPIAIPMLPSALYIWIKDDVGLVKTWRIAHHLPRHLLAESLLYLQSREMEREGCRHMTEIHPSVTTVFEMALRQNGGRRLTPVQIVEANDALTQQQLSIAQQQAAAQQVFFMPYHLRLVAFQPLFYSNLHWSQRQE